MKLLKSLAFACAFAALSAPAYASPISIMIGDNDGYGMGIPDNGSLGTPYPIIDNRSAAEAAATNGAQFTDVYSALYAGAGPNGNTGSFIFNYSGALTSASLTLDMADFQSSAFGALAVNVNGITLPFSFDDGWGTSVVRTIALTAGMIGAANNAGFLSLNFDRNGSADYIAFDYVKLVGEVSAVPLPASGLLLLGPIGALVAMRRRRKTA